MAEYSKHTPNDVLAKYTITNRGKERATVHVLPTLWFRNVWSWGEDAYVSQRKVFLLVTIEFLLFLCYFTSRTRIFCLMFKDVTFTGEGLQNLDLGSTILDFERGS